MNAALLLSEIYIYPVKSLAGIKLQTAQVEERGLQHDRRWLVIDQNNNFVSQREKPEMELIDVALSESGLSISHRTKPELGALAVPFLPETFDILTVIVWDDTTEAIIVNAASNRWFSAALEGDFRLVFMPDTSLRTADRRYAPFDANVSFADGFPYLLIGQASLDDLNARLDTPIEMLRFRPNFVVTGSQAHDEDNWKAFTVNDLDFLGVKPCARCTMTTIDLQTAETGKEPLKTLATYRRQNNKILFGQNVLAQANGAVSIGDVVEIVRSSK
jgi:uncharacterized protein YcbX